MLKSNASVEHIVKETAEYLRRHIKIDKMILFGSYNNGNPREDSDFDIAVISKDFEKMSLLKKMELLAMVAVAVDSRVELLGFSTKEYSNPGKSSFIEKVKQEGRCLFEGNKGN